MSLTPEQNDRLTEILQVLGAEIDDITGNSQQFVRDQIARHNTYGDQTRVSVKQWAWLEDLYKKHARLPEVERAEGDPRDLDDDIPW